MRLAEINQAENPRIWEYVSATMDQGESNKIVNQLFSLNLTVQSKTYPYGWMTTPKGLLKAGRLRALKKGELYPGEQDWCEIIPSNPQEVDRSVANAPLIFEDW